MQNQNEGKINNYLQNNKCHGTVESEMKATLVMFVHNANKTKYFGVQSKHKQRQKRVQKAQPESDREIKEIEMRRKYEAIEWH